MTKPMTCVEAGCKLRDAELTDEARDRAFDALRLADEVLAKLNDDALAERICQNTKISACAASVLRPVIAAYRNAIRAAAEAAEGK